jgi:hypothetical protein
MTDNNFILGNISKVLWHTCSYKVSQNNYGHMLESFDEENMIIKEIVEDKDSSGNITNSYPYRTLNKIMASDKNYAMVTLDKYGNIFVRNFFDSKHPEGFSQKNTYFSDDISDKFMMSDENDVLLNYIKLGCPKVTDIKNLDKHYFLYFCIEYKMNDGLNQNLLNYFILLETKMIVMKTRLTDIETKIKEQKGIKNKVINNQNSYLPNFRFRFF